MYGIDLDKPITYKNSSLRFFEKNERHVSRFCTTDVLLLVYDGVLRFSEDGEQHEVREGEYYIQHRNTFQAGEIVSDAPKYLYVHFCAEWNDGEHNLPRSGPFDYTVFSHLINEIDRASHDDTCTYTQRAGLFYTLLSELYNSIPVTDTPAKQIESFISEQYLSITSLEDICKAFHYSKNHIINVFKAEYGMTPFDYINELKLKKAMYMLEVTSKPLDEIALQSGFNHYSHFYRLFVRKNAISPYEWRKKAKLNMF